MFFKPVVTPIASLILLASSLAGCSNSISTDTPTPALTPIISEPVLNLATSAMPPSAALDQPSPTHSLSAYAFPASIDPAQRYLFYLHGKIIEDQGLPAVSPDFGEYQYAAILQRLSENGFIVISETRPKDSATLGYARKLVAQVQTLLKAGVPAGHITIIGASKGAAIAVYASHLLQNPQVNFVLLAICHPDNLAAFQQDSITLAGNVLSIYDASDELAGSCQPLFTSSQGEGLASHDEIVVHLGLRHGLLYKPLDEWVIPTIYWAKK
jgi:hypothetical protein